MIILLIVEVVANSNLNMLDWFVFLIKINYLSKLIMLRLYITSCFRHFHFPRICWCVCVYAEN